MSSGTSKTPEAALDRFTFVVLNDTHYMTPECGAWLGTVIERIRAERPEFVLHLGDLVDVGTRENHAVVRDVFSTLGVPLYPVIGNHDYATQEDRRGYEAIHPGRLNYRFRHRGIEFIGVDSTEGLRYENTLIPESTLRWVETELAGIERAQPLVLFTHFPLANGVRMQPRNAPALLERFRQHNVRAVFTGHFHGHTVHPFGSAVITTCPCCSLKARNLDGTRAKGYYVCTAREGEIERRFVEVSVSGF